LGPAVLVASEFFRPPEFCFLPQKGLIFLVVVLGTPL